MAVFLAADLEAIPGTKPSSGGSPTPPSATPSEHLEAVPVASSTGSASVAVETAFTAPAFVASAPAAAPAVTTSAFTASAATAPAFTFAPEQAGSVALNNSASSVTAMDSQFFSFGASDWTYGGSSNVIENWGQNADVVGPAVFHFVEAANWSTPDSDSGSWFTDWLYDLFA